MPGPSKPGLLALRFYYAASFAALGVYLPNFPVWLEARGIEGLAMGATSALMPAMGFVAPPAWGVLADALGLRGAILRIACAGAGLAFLGIGLAYLLGPGLTFGPLFLGVAAYAFFRSPMTLVADTLAIEQAKGAGTTYGRIRLWGSVGFLVAAALVGYALDPFAPAPLPLAVGTALLGACAASFALPARWARSPEAPLAAGQGLGSLLSDGVFRAFLFATFLSQLAHSSYDICFSLRLRDLGARPGAVGALWALGVLAEIGLMYAAAPLFERFRPLRLLAFALASAALRWILVSVLRSPLALALVQPMHALSFGLMWIAGVAFVKARSRPSTLARAQGLFTAAIGAGSVVGMVGWGALYRAASGEAVFAAAAVFAAGAAALTAAVDRAERLRASASAPEATP